MSKTTVKTAERRMEYVEITQMEEMPVLSDQEKTELIASIKEAEAQIDRGEGTLLKPDEIEPWLKGMYEEAVQRRRDAK
jgi:hypothetical protein